MSQATLIPIAPTPPKGEELSPYDKAHLVTYLRLLDADAAGADRQTAAQFVLSLDPASNLQAARLTYDAHLAVGHAG
jgi:hypothetical protein